MSAIIVIEADKAIRDGIATLFETIEQPVCCYADAASFLKSDCLKQAGCIISAARLPDANAVNLLQRLRERGLDVPVILLCSGPTDTYLSERARAFGRLTVVNKPLVNSNLVAQVRELLLQ